MTCRSFKQLAFTLVAPAVVACVWFGPTKVTGQTDKTFKEQPAVRHRLLYRSTRLELTPSVSTSLSEPYINDRMVNLNVVYHLTDTLNLGVFGGFTALQSETDLHSKVDTVLRRDDPDRLQRLGYSHTQWLAGFEFGFVPVFGKFMLFNSTALHYDIHLLGGVSYVNRKAEPAVDNGVPSDPVLSGTRPSPTLGVGSRLYISDGMALNLQFRDYIYSETPLSVGNGESTLSQNYTLSLGLSFFLPGEPEISR